MARKVGASIEVKTEVVGMYFSCDTKKEPKRNALNAEIQTPSASCDSSATEIEETPGLTVFRERKEEFLEFRKSDVLPFCILFMFIQ